MDGYEEEKEQSKELDENSILYFRKYFHAVMRAGFYKNPFFGLITILVRVTVKSSNHR